MKLSGNKNQAKKPVKKISGFIVWEGLSRFDKKPIVAIATLETKNEKTGNMIQLWIMRSDIEPHIAIKTGEDQSVCGGCVHRHHSNGSCYVTVHQAPLAVYRSYKKGNYPSLSLDEMTPYLTGRSVRFGAYGDPAMLPYHVLSDLHLRADFITGYTHQWKIKRLRDTLDFCQGSVDNTKEYYELKSIKKDAKSFRVVRSEVDLLPGEVECLSDSDGLTCEDCRLCNGQRKDVAIMVHGSKSNKFTADIPVNQL
jgi:hypothetical protein